MPQSARPGLPGLPGGSVSYPRKDSNDPALIVRGRTRSTRASPRTNMNIRNLSLNRSGLAQGQRNETDPAIDLTITQPGSVAGLQSNENTAVTWNQPFGGGIRGFSGLVPAPSAAEGSATRRKRSDPSPGTRLQDQQTEEAWSDLLGQDIGITMRKKAELGFGLDVRWFNRNYYYLMTRLTRLNFIIIKVTRE